MSYFALVTQNKSEKASHLIGAHEWTFITKGGGRSKTEPLTTDFVISLKEKREVYIILASPVSSSTSVSFSDVIYPEANIAEGTPGNLWTGVLV